MTGRVIVLALALFACLLTEDRPASAAILGQDDMKVVYGSPPESPLRIVAKSVGLLEVSNGQLYSAACTATLVSSNLVLTAAHCIPESTAAAKLRLGYLDRESEPGESFAVDVKPLLIDKSANYALLRVKDVPSDKYPWVKAVPRAPRAGEAVFMLHYPAGKPMMLSECKIDKVEKGEVLHQCDTMGGSSGAIVFALSDGAIVGMHTAGAPGGYNIAASSELIAFSRFPADAAAASTTVSTLGLEKRGLSVAPAPERRVALLIANGDYRGGLRPLKDTYGDIDVMKQMLSGAGFNVDNRRDLNRVDLLRVIEDFANVAAADPDKRVIAFVYYSGHGAADPVDKQNFLIPTDARLSADLWNESVELGSWIEKAKKRAPNAEFIVVVDACRDEYELPSRAPAFGFFLPERMSNIFLVMATGANRSAFEGKSGENTGQFMSAFKEEFPKRGRTITTLFDEVRYRVSSQTRGVQKPEFVNGLNQRLFLNGEPDPMLDYVYACAEGGAEACEELTRRAQAKLTQVCSGRSDEACSAAVRPRGSN